jgi:SAM-dependent methyltransferase
MMIVNTDQAEQWNTGEDAAHWVNHQDRYDRMNAPFADMILDAAALRSGADVLDVGCGCGTTTLAAARLIAPGHAVGLDLSGPMLARARAAAEAASLGNAEFVQGDAQVHAMQPGRFGTVLSRFGVMFFADPVAAFANIRSAAEPAGRLVFVCWQPLAANQWLLVPRAAMAEHVPPAGGPGPGDGPGMFALADPDRIRQVLDRAGWRDVKVTAEQRSVLVGGGGSLDEAVEFLRTSAIGRAALTGADPGAAARALASLRAALAPHADDEGVHLTAAVWLVQATAT